MASLNKVMLIGNLTKDPELKYTPGGAAVCEFTVAVNRRWSDKASGEKKEEVSFFDIVAWNRTAEVAAQYLKKGRSVFVEARAEQQRWKTEDGQNRSRIRFVAESLQFMGGKRDEEGGGEVSQAPPADEQA